GEVRRHQQRLHDQLASLQQPEGHISALQAAAETAAAAFLTRARALSAARKSAAAPFATRLKAELADLAMPHADVEFRFHEAVSEGEWSAAGLDRAELLLSANPGEAPRPLARVASGGELSRVMLAVKV